MKLFNSGEIVNQIGERSLKVEVSDMLQTCGYSNFFFPEEKTAQSVVINSGEIELEFDNIVQGNEDCFEKFRSQFLHSYVPFAPATANHILIVEVKLNSNLLMEWTEGSNHEDSRNLFFNPCPGTKVVIINGGKESLNFMHNLSSTNPDIKYIKCIDKLKSNNINVFYKLWSSAETIIDIFNEQKEIRKRQDEIQKDLNESKAELNEAKADLNETKAVFAAELKKLRLIE